MKESEVTCHLPMEGARTEMRSEEREILLVSVLVQEVFTTDAMEKQTPHEGDSQNENESIM